jgi:hypothetical protein
MADRTASPQPIDLMEYETPSRGVHFFPLAGLKAAFVFRG